MPTVKEERRTTNRKPTTRPRQSGNDVAARGAAEAVEKRYGATMDEIRELGSQAAPLGPLGVGEAAAESDVTGELSGGGVAFGEFVKSVGLAVAAAQAKLDETLKDTAKALSD